MYDNILVPAISASVSCMDLGHIDNQIKAIEESSIAFFHYDVVDGYFNKCYVLGDLLCQYIKKNSGLPIEVHLAVYDVDTYINIFSQSGVDYIAVHYEAMKNHQETLRKIKKLGIIPILAYRAETAPGDDFVNLARECAWVLKLTVNPGVSGQKINPIAIEHIKIMRNMLKKNDMAVRIQADGNVNSNTIIALAEAGANIFTGGSSGLFLKEKSIQENIENLLFPIKNIIL